MTAPLPLDALLNDPMCATEALNSLQDAVEGECDGLAISDEQARAILEHIVVSVRERASLASPLPAEAAPKGVSVGVREALEKIACRHVTIEPLWWQVEARAALAALTQEATPAAGDMADLIAVDPVAWQRRLFGPKVTRGNWHEVTKEQADYGKAHGHPEGFSDIQCEIRPLYTAASLASLSARLVEVERRDADLRTYTHEAQKALAYLKGEFAAMCRRAEAAEAKLAEAGKALEPFAKHCDELDSLGHEDDSTCVWRLSARDIRRARTVFREAQ